MFSPYTPIPYHNNKMTKYTHDHIDLVGFINENQLNVNESYLKGFYGDDKSKYYMNDYHTPFKIDKKHNNGHH